MDTLQKSDKKSKQYTSKTLKRIERYLDHDISILVRIGTLQNMCHIEASTPIDMNHSNFETIIQILNHSSKIGWYRYVSETHELELVTTIWMENTSNKEVIQELIDMVTVELSVSSLMFPFLGQENHDEC